MLYLQQFLMLLFLMLFIFTKSLFNYLRLPHNSFPFSLFLIFLALRFSSLFLSAKSVLFLFLSSIFSIIFASFNSFCSVMAATILSLLILIDFCSNSFYFIFFFHRQQNLSLIFFVGFYLSIA